MEPARKKERATAHGWRCDPLKHRSPCILGHLELNWPARLSLDYRHAVSDSSGNDEIGHFQSNKIAPAKFAVDCEVEQHEVALVPSKFEPRTNCPDLSWL